MRYPRISDQTIGSIAYNPASQIQSQVKSNDAYAWSGHYNVNRNYTVNGLNQQTVAGATTLGYDGRGNLTTSGTSTYGYNKLNQLISGPNPAGGSAALTYDPAGRLSQIVGTGTTRFAYAGTAIIQEVNTTGTVLRRYVPGPGTDEPVVWYEGSGTASRRWLHADERGSVIAVSDGAGAMLGINRYDEYGIPQSSNLGRFQYTGQAWLPELGMYSYKARIYSPTLGRFMQTDPIGYGDGVNWYNYVGGDPVNKRDPSGLITTCTLKDAGPRIWFYDYNHDGIPQLKEIVGVTRDQTAECSDDGSGAEFGNGGDGGNANAAGPKPNPKISPKPTPCISKNAGPVNIRGGSFTFVLIAGGTFSYGTFDIPSIGAHGRFSAGGGSLGLEGFVGGFTGSYDHFSDFNGKSFTVSGAIPETPFGGSATSNTPSGNQTGYTLTGGIGGGGSYTMGGTHIISSNIPICP